MHINSHIAWLSGSSGGWNSVRWAKLGIYWRQREAYWVRQGFQCGVQGGWNIFCSHIFRTRDRACLQIPKEMNLDVVGVFFIRENRKDNSFALVLQRDVALFRRYIFQCSIIYQVIFFLFRRTLSLFVYTCTNRPEARCSFSNSFIAINMKHER